MDVSNHQLPNGEGSLRIHTMDLDKVAEFHPTTDQQRVHDVGASVKEGVLLVVHETYEHNDRAHSKHKVSKGSIREPYHGLCHQ